ncbi:hypothetical protein QJS66_13105 [Kocuria rhizophila]|nr:hypothetical protein QJS66_13105 [Kocuria rhizophila]
MTNPLTTLPVPMVQAPMAGGPSTPTLAGAVARAGGWACSPPGTRAPRRWPGRSARSARDRLA